MSKKRKRKQEIKRLKQRIKTQDWHLTEYHHLVERYEKRIAELETWLTNCRDSNVECLEKIHKLKTELAAAEFELRCFRSGEKHRQQRIAELETELEDALTDAYGPEISYPTVADPDVVRIFPDGTVDYKGKIYPSLAVVWELIKADEATERGETCPNCESHKEDAHNELLAANITIEKIRDNLWELLTGRIADWLNTQGDTSTSLSGGHTEVKYAKINSPSIRPEFPIQPDDYPEWQDAELVETVVQPAFQIPPDEDEVEFPDVTVKTWDGDGNEVTREGSKYLSYQDEGEPPTGLTRNELEEVEYQPLR